MWICCKQITDFLFIYSLFTFVWWIFSLNSSRAVAHSCTIHHEYLKCGIQTIFLTVAVWCHIKTFPIYKYPLTLKKKTKTKLDDFSLYTHLPDYFLQKYKRWDLLSVGICWEVMRALALPPSRGRCETPLRSPTHGRRDFRTGFSFSEH